jgi:hypothetical protein
MTQPRSKEFVETSPFAKNALIWQRFRCLSSRGWIGAIAGLAWVLAVGNLGRSQSQASVPDEPLCYLRMQDGRTLNLQAMCGKSPQEAAPPPTATRSPAPGPPADSSDSAVPVESPRGTSTSPDPAPSDSPAASAAPATAPTAPPPPNPPKTVQPNATYDDRRF